MRYKSKKWCIFVVLIFGLSILGTTKSLATSECLQILPEQWKTRRLPPRSFHELKFIKDDSIFIPVIGDVHGDLEGLLNLISNLQIETQVKFPWVLQVGDLGINQDPLGFPRWPRKNKDQIVRAYFGDRSILERYFQSSFQLKDLEANIVFVRGNHDFLTQSFLLSTKLTQVMDHFYYLPDGVVENIPLLSDKKIRIGALGGIDESTSPTQRNHSERYEIGISSTSKQNILSYPQTIDILLTHQGPDFEFKGSSLINQLLRDLGPKLHFHGHSHFVSNRINRVAHKRGGTHTHALSNLPEEIGISGISDFDQETVHEEGLKNVRLTCSMNACYALIRYDLVSKELELFAADSVAYSP